MRAVKRGKHEHSVTKGFRVEHVLLNERVSILLQHVHGLHTTFIFFSSSLELSPRTRRAPVQP